MKKVTVALLGAGGRGKDSYGAYALKHPDEIQFVAVAEPNEERRLQFSRQHGIKSDMCFKDWRELLGKEKLADGMLICTQDKMHFEPSVKSLEKGYHVMLEKPMAADPKECVMLGEYARKYKRIFLICHVLRYTNFFSTMKKLLDDGVIGQLISIQHNENVAYWHQAHSFVRGNWRNSKESSPMILAKCCHDMDLMLWFAGADCIKIASFGSLTHFKKENAPEGSPNRCLDGCPAEKKCPYYAPNIYLTENTGWPTSAISDDASLEARTRALIEGPYGRCVYKCDNDVVDHQVISAEFANQVTAAFTMSAFTNDCTRTIKLMGTKGEIRGSMEKREIEVLDFLTGNKNIIQVGKAKSGHGGGDSGIMGEFIENIRKGDISQGLTSAAVSVQSHLMAFAAEKSRLENKVVDIKEFEKSFSAF